MRVQKGQKKLLFQILGTWLGLAALGAIAYYAGQWNGAKYGIYVNALGLPFYFYYKYRRSTKQLAGTEQGRSKRDAGVLTWNEKNKFAGYATLWTWMFCATAAFLLADAGHLGAVALSVLVGLIVLVPVAIYFASRRMKADDDSGAALFGRLRWDEQPKAVFYGSAKMWNRIAALALLLYFLGWWVPVLQLLVYAFAAFCPLYFFLITKRLGENFL